MAKNADGYEVLVLTPAQAACPVCWDKLGDPQTHVCWWTVTPNKEGS